MKPTQKIYTSVSDMIGHTPLLALNRYRSSHSSCAYLLAKLEYFNPTGSVKDRVAAAMIDAAETNGQLKPGAVIIEPTSGNTGIGLASIAASRGYKLVLVMPETMSEERRTLLKAYGAELVLTDGKLGMPGAIAKAKELAEQMENSFIPGQFDNPANPAIHKATTGPEIWEDTGGTVDAFVAGIGTGGSISGAGEYLKNKNPAIKIIGVEPASSPLFTCGKTGPHKIQGIGAGFHPKTFRKELCDEILVVADESAMQTAKELARLEGILVGISSGAVVAAATQLAMRQGYAGKTIVALLPDSGDRYLSLGVYAEDFPN